MGVFFARNITTLKSTPTPFFGEILEFIANGRIFEIVVYSWYRWFPWGWEGGNNGADLLCCSFIPNLGKESIAWKCTISDKFETRRAVLRPVVT